MFFHTTTVNIVKILHTLMKACVKMGSRPAVPGCTKVGYAVIFVTAIASPKEHGKDEL